MDRVGRRTILIWPMFGCAIALFLVSLGHLLPIWLGTVCFFGYLYIYGIMSILPGVYPEEVFPTSIRTSGVGLASAASRIGAAIGTFLLPLSLSHLGLSWSMIFMGVVSLIGGITALMWAPETNQLNLTDTGHRDADREAGGPRARPRRSRCRHRPASKRRAHGRRAQERRAERVRPPWRGQPEGCDGDNICPSHPYPYVPDAAFGDPMHQAGGSRPPRRNRRRPTT